MVTKGIIKRIDYTGNTCDIRVPFFETVGTPEVILEQATFSVVPGIEYSYDIDDVVYVAFEDGKMYKPVVIGKLYNPVRDNSDVRGIINCKELKAENQTLLDTYMFKGSTDPFDNALKENNITTVYELLATILDMSRKIQELEDKIKS